MRKALDEMFPRELVNKIKIDSNEMEAEAGVCLIGLIEKGLIEVVGETEHGVVMYRKTQQYLEMLYENVR